MSAEIPQALQRAGIRRVVHDRPAGTRVAIPGSLLWRHFEPELRARFLRPSEARTAEEGSD